MIIKINFLDESIKNFKIMFKNKPQYFVFVCFSVWKQEASERWF